jgi:hypothetical protein
LLQDMRVAIRIWWVGLPGWQQQLACLPSNRCRPSAPLGRACPALPCPACCAWNAGARAEPLLQGWRLRGAR